MPTAACTNVCLCLWLECGKHTCNKIIGLFCKRALLKIPYSAKETYDVLGVLCLECGRKCAAVCCTCAACVFVPVMCMMMYGACGEECVAVCCSVLKSSAVCCTCVCACGIYAEAVHVAALLCRL